jgi:hypothetical protein
MSPLVKKEIRVLLPAWFAALAVIAVLPPCLQFLALNNVPYNPDILSVWFGLGCLLLSLATFGNEFSAKTFPVQLSQPIERSSIWWTKVLILAIAFASILLVLFVCYRVYFQLNPVYHIPFPFGVLIICGLVIFSGGLWTTLLVRRMLEAFWLTLLTPLAIMFALFAVHEHFRWSNQTDNYVIPTVLLLYSLAGFFWARRMFLRAQDTQWTGGVIAFPSRKRIAERTTASSRRRHWFAALVWKELQLQQVNILIAGIVLALDLVSVIIRKFHPHFTDPNVKGLLELVWVLWLLMPLLIGSVAVAEEHRSGTFESQVSLPVSRRIQFILKFSVALILSLILGGVMPFVIERARDFNDSIFIVAAAIFFISFYASTVARTTIQAIGLTIIVAAAIYFCAVATAVSIFQLGGGWAHAQVGLGLLRLYLGVPIFLLTLAGLMYWNFKWLHPEGKLRWRNSLIVLVSFAFIFVATNGIYFRTWEFLTPVPSPRGPVRLHSSKEIKFAANGNAIYAVLPDGRLWMDTLAWCPGFDRWSSWLSTIVPSKCRVQWVGGSNWITVAANQYLAIGIQSNGSLWSLQQQWNRVQGRWQSNAPKLTQIGSETNWWQASGDWHGFLLLKKDGSLWVWGTNRVGLQEPVQKKLREDLAMQPARFEQQTDWVGLLSSGFAYARKRDGSIWEWTHWIGGTNRVSIMVQNTNLDGFWPKFAFSADQVVGINSNRELWFYGEPRPSPGRSLLLRKIQLGPTAKWKATTLGGSSIIAIRSDGTLWNWPDYWNGLNEKQPVQLGNYFNWLSLSSPPLLNAGVFVLAADGSLWIWDEPSRHVWLMSPRKPVYLGNIFTAH